MNRPAWTREPLVHFLAAGALIFGLFSLGGEEVDPESRKIAIDAEQLAQLALQFERTMSRPPTDAELDRQVERFIREEVLYREALRLGLDRGDAVVRRRMAQKMDMLASARVEAARPDEATLRQWYQDNRARFARDARYDFDQLWFEDKAAAGDALARLESGADWRQLGGAISLPRSVSQMARGEVANRFGRQFAERLDALEPGGWQGPVASGMGWHIVRLSSRELERVPPFEEVTDEVEDDWRISTIAARREEAYQVLREAYDVTVER